MPRRAALGYILEGVVAGSFGVSAVTLVVTAAPLPASLALACVVGSLLGAGIAIASLGIERLRAPLRRIAWAALGIVAGLYVAHALGTFQKLAGATFSLALVTLGSCLAGGCALGLAFAVPRLGVVADAPHTRAIPRWRRWMAPSALLLSLAPATYEASAYWLHAYPVARQSLVGAAWLLAVSAARSALEFLPGRAKLLLRWTSLPALAASGLFVLLLPSDKMGPLLANAQTRHLVAGLRALTDWDRDGHSSLLGGRDCRPLDARVHPSARELPGNGVDDNCRYGDGSLPPAPVAAGSASPVPPSVNVLLITIDSLRADHLTPYGYERETTPNLASLAASGVLFENAYTSGGWTCLALPSLFSSVRARELSFRAAALTRGSELLELPWQPKLRDGDGFKVMVTLPLRKSRWTLQAALQQRGLRTAAVYPPQIEHVASALGPGWDTMEVSAAHGDDRAVTALALRRITRLATIPFFLWVHYFNPHGPQTEHDAPRFGEGISDRYDHEVAATDREVGKLVAAVDALGHRPTVVLVTGDHGEAFQWGFQFHGNDLFEDGIRVPLLLRAPGAPQGRVTTPVSSIDIAPTLLSLTGAPSPGELEGSDLLRVSGERTVVTDLWRLDRDARVYVDQIAVTDSSRRLIFDRLAQRTSMHRVRDLRRPPLELKEAPSPRLTGTLEAYLEHHQGGP